MDDEELQQPLNDPIFGTPEEFVQNYGDITEDGTPRFGEDYVYLFHSKELNWIDRIRFELFG